MAGNHREVITLLSAGGHVLCTSPAGTKVFGYLQDELSGKRVIDLVHPDDHARCRRALAAVLIRPPDPRHVEVRVRRQDGEWSWFGATIFSGRLRGARFATPRRSVRRNCRVEIRKCFLLGSISQQNQPLHLQKPARIRASVDHAVQQ